MWCRRGPAVFDPAKLTDYEREALKEARQPFAAALEAAGLMAPFFDQPAAVIDKIMLAAVEGFRVAMERKDKFGDNGVPF